MIQICVDIKLGCDTVGYTWLLSILYKYKQHKYKQHNYKQHSLFQKCESYILF